MLYTEIQGRRNVYGMGEGENVVGIPNKRESPL